ncbi:MAG: type II toxin-antitoxin system RelE/ParE family toxin [Synechococcus sp.]|nr:type II toxin-antitoxin system RelE/ParE family toxin [Synechococcus sp.]
MECTPQAAKALRKLDRQTQMRVVSDLESLRDDCQSPRDRGKGLTAQPSEFWRYRVGDFRLICRIHDQELIVLIVEPCWKPSLALLLA